MSKMLEPQFGDIFEWPHAPMTGQKMRVMFIRRDNKYKTESALDDTMTCMVVVAGDYGATVGLIKSDSGPTGMYTPIEQPR
jgi:hypothetical protein